VALCPGRAVPASERLATPREKSAKLSPATPRTLSTCAAFSRWDVVTSTLPTLPWIVRLSAPRRLAIVLFFGVASFLLLQQWVPGQTRLLISWNLGAITYLALSWVTIWRADPTMTRIRAQLQDQSGYVIFLLVVTAASTSFVAIGFLVGDIKGMPFWQRTEHLALSIAALLLSWLLIQTLFGFHYARLYYSRHPGSADDRRGLKFPGDKEPDYFDFAYYSFVVGMTSQVSDVAVCTRRMRRITLVHGVLSFIYNIAILAMSINIIGGTI
jgi:uncharacterized membrane protein